MYDATHETVSSIPLDAQMVAGYISDHTATQSIKWTAADWARFPNAVKVRITGDASINDGDVLDVESGAASVGDVVPWLTMRRAAGATPSVYCSESLRGSVEQAIASAGIALPPFWIAWYNGVASLDDVPGAVAKQYTDPGPYDISVVADHWPGVDAPAPPTEEDVTTMEYAQSPDDGHYHRFWIDNANELREQWYDPNAQPGQPGSGWTDGFNIGGVRPGATVGTGVVGGHLNVGTVAANGAPLCRYFVAGQGWIPN